MSNSLQSKTVVAAYVERFLRTIGSSTLTIIMAVCLFVAYCVYVAIVHFGTGGLWSG